MCGQLAVLRPLCSPKKHGIHTSVVRPLTPWSHQCWHKLALPACNEARGTLPHSPGTTSINAHSCSGLLASCWLKLLTQTTTLLTTFSCTGLPACHTCARHRPDVLSWGLVGYSFFLLAVAIWGDTHGTFSLDLIAAGSPELHTGAPG